MLYSSEYVTSVISDASLYKDNPKISIEDTRDGNKTAKISIDNRSVYINSKYNVSREAEKLANDISPKEDSIIICFGLGFGYHIKELLKKCSENNFIFIYEPDEELFLKIYHSENNCINEFLNNKRIAVVVSKEVQFLKAHLLSMLGPEHHDKIMYASMYGYDKLYPEIYVDFLKAIKEVSVSKLSDVCTSLENVELWTNNLFCNTYFIWESYNAADFKDKFKDKPVIVVSAGPSLSKNIELLKEIKDRVLIISVFVAAKVLLTNGITPDFIVAVDGKQAFTDERLKEIPLLYIPTVPLHFTLSHTGKKVVTANYVEDYTTQLLNKYNKPAIKLKTGGSVACIALDFAVMLGANPAVLIGQDLAYTNNQFHVTGTDHFEKTMDDVNWTRKFKVPAIGGGEVYTDNIWYNYILWFEGYAKKCPTKIIDATEGGAVIKNTEIMTLREVIDKYCNYNDFSVSRTLNSVFDKGTIFTKEQQESLKLQLQTNLEILREIDTEIDEGIELANKLIKTCKYSSNTKQVDKLIAKLSKYDKCLDRLLENKHLLGFLLQPTVYLLTREKMPDDSNEVHIAKKSLILYEGIKNAVKNIIPIFEEYMKAVEEQKNKKD